MSPDPTTSPTRPACLPPATDEVGKIATAAPASAVPPPPAPSAPPSAGEHGRRRGRVIGRFRTHGPLSAAEWRYVLRRTVYGFTRHRGIDAAAALTYFACLTLFPVALTLVSGLALVAGSGRAIAAILGVVGEVARPATVATVRGPLLQLSTIPAPGLALSVGLVLTVWTASAYATCFGRALNGFYAVQEGRRIWRFRGSMMLLSLPLIAGGAVVSFLVLTTPDVAQAVAMRFGVGAPWVMVYEIAKWPVVAAVLALMLGALYLWAPNVERQTVNPISWGALVAIVGCVAASLGFAVYIGTVGHYDAIYGALGGAVVLLIWLFLINIVLVYGASLDTEMVRMHHLRDGVPSEAVIKVPLRDTTRNLALARTVAALEVAGRAIREESAIEAGGHGRHRESIGAARYRGGMMRREAADGTPPIERVEQDFRVPGDADLRPVADVADEGDAEFEDDGS